MASKTLTAKVAINTTNAHRSLDKLMNKIKSINNVINKNTNAKGLDKQLEKALLQQEKLRQATLKTQLAESKVTTQNYKSNKAKTDASIAEERLTQAKHRTALAEQKVVNATERAKKSTNALLSAAKKLAGTYLGIKTIGVAIKASDTVTSTQNRLNALNGYDTKQTAETMDKVYAAAQRSRSGYDKMLDNVSKTITLAPDAFQGNIDNAIRFQEIMAKSYTIGGASAAEQHTSMYQLVQALSSGVLQGDELRSVREGAPLAYKAIEEFAQGVYNTEESLKDLASQGMITSDMVVAAIMDSGDKIEEKFNNTKVTFAQAWTQIKNIAMKAFQPALESLNQMLNSDAGRAIVEGIGAAMLVVGNIVSWVINLFASFFNWCADNWYWLQWIVYSVVAALLVYFTILAAQAIWTGITAFISFLMGLSPLYIWILVIGLVVAALVWLAGSFEDVCGMIVGVIMAAVAFIWNLTVGIVNGILQFLWTRFVEPFIGIIEWILNVCNGGFDSFGGAVANLIGQIISWFLSLGKVVTKIIDAIFGTNWTDGLSSLQDKVLSWGKNENSITISREAPSLKDIGVDRWSYSNAYSKGYNWGKAGGDWITDKVSGIGNMLTGNGLPNPNDPKYSVDGAYNDDNIKKNLDDINDNTGKIKDSVDLTNDDLDYLRKIAEMEWRNEFTTAEIRVDMTNHNSITSERDWEGMLEYLSDTLKEEMNEVAYGVHY